MNEFLDTQNIENDRRDSNDLPLFYEYRISYIDINGVETPDPVNPLSNTEEPFASGRPLPPLQASNRQLQL